MKYISQSFSVAVLALISTQSFSQVSLSTLQKLALLNSNNAYTFSTEVKEILQPQKFKNIGGGKWVKSTTGKELITIMASYDGNMISYEVNNMPSSKNTIQSIKKTGNYVFNNEEDLKTHFRNTDKKLYYDVLYSKDFNRCIISIYPYKEPKKEEVIKKDTIRETAMVTITKDAEFIGGENALTKYISQNIDKPDDLDWSGRLVVQFFVEKDGSIIDVEIEGSCPSYFKNSIIATFKRMPKWKPAQTSEGTLARSQKQIPLQF